MTTKKQTKPRRKSQSVIEIKHYRRSPNRIDFDQPAQPSAKRIAEVRSTATTHLANDIAPPLALVMVTLRADGQLSSVVESVEPELAEVFATELVRLADRLRLIARKIAIEHGQKGSAILPVLVSIAFMAATFLNENAILDAGLSLTAQLSAVALARRRE